MGWVGCLACSEFSPEVVQGLYLWEGTVDADSYYCRMFHLNLPFFKSLPEDAEIIRVPLEKIRSNGRTTIFPSCYSSFGFYGPLVPCGRLAEGKTIGEVVHEFSMGCFGKGFEMSRELNGLRIIRNFSNFQGYLAYALRD